MKLHRHALAMRCPARALLLLLLPALGVGPLRAAAAPEEIVTARLEWEPGAVGGVKPNRVPFEVRGATAPKETTPLAALQNPRYARIRMGGAPKGLTIAMDAVPNGPRLWVDHDFDLDLRDEKRIWMKEVGTGFQRSQVVLVPYPDQSEPTRAELRFLYRPTQAPDHLEVYAWIYRRGTVVLGGRLRIVALADRTSDLRFDDAERDRLYVDLDGNGRFDTAGDAERVVPGTPFRVGDEGWIARVPQMSGAVVEFTRTADVPPETPRTWVDRSVGVRRTPPPPTESLTELSAAFAREEGKPYAERQGTIMKIGAVGTPAAFDVLARVVEKDPDVSIQMAAIRACGHPAYLERGGKRVIDWALRGKSNWASAAAQALHDMQHPQRERVYLEMMGSSVTTRVSAAARYLAAMGTERSRKSVLDACRNHALPVGRYYAYTMGARYLPGGPPPAVMLRAVEEDYVSLRAEAAKDLHAIGHPRSRDVALALAAERPVTIQTAQAAAEILGAAGDAESVEALLGLLAEASLHANARKTIVDQLRFVRAPKSVAVLTKAIRAKSPAVRAVSAEVLASLAERDVTFALIKQARKEKDPNALAAQLEALGDHADPAALDVLFKHVKRRKSGLRPVAIRALARIGFGKTKVREFFLALLDARSWMDRVLALDAAGASGDRALCGAVLESLDHEIWQVRVAAVDAIDALRCPAAIEPLIGRLEVEEEERLRDAIAKTLFRLTAMNFYDDATVWKRWWEQDGATFSVPDEIPEAIESDVGGTGSGFYGIPIKTERVVFVIDQSGSMSAMGRAAETEKEEDLDRLDVAVQEVLAAVGQMKNRARVNVILFHSTIHPWRDTLQRLSKGNRRALEKHLLGMKPTGGTNLYDGLEMALQAKDVDTIFLLSDGAPGLGKYVATPDILRAVRRLNQTRRIAIHCVSIGAASDLLRRLARENGGKYVQR